MLGEVEALAQHFTHLFCHCSFSLKLTLTNRAAAQKLAKDEMINETFFCTYKWPYLKVR